jgi:hypothetical protein
MQPSSDKPPNSHFANLPNGLIVRTWGDGVMIGVVDQNTRHGVSTYLGHDGIVRLFSWLIAAGIVEGEIAEEERGDVMLQWPGPAPDAS